MQIHSRGFFGTKSGLILESGDWSTDCIYLTFIKKNGNNMWEKPSNGQGKKIKFNLGETIMLLKVLKNEINRWSIVHKFNNEQTIIIISKDSSNGGILFRVDNYYKSIKTPELDILILLLEHIIGEKIEHATGKP
ncbi:MAG: hypothetical protein ACTSRZ_19120 [Promethearchaeota archaeon]